MTGTCTRCGRARKLRRRDLCGACYQTLWKSGCLPELPAKRRAPRVVRECRHAGRPHRHGTRDAYVSDRCRCEPCTGANTAEARARSHRRAMARWNQPDSAMVDGETVRAHLRALMDAGMGWKRIASLAGVSSSTVSSILYGEHRYDPSHPDYRPPRKQMRRRIADALLGVRLDLADRALVDATGARRRLQALVVVGWSQSRLAQMVGMTPASLGLLIHGRRDRVLVSTAAAVQRLYDAHWAAGPVPTNRAERSGFVRVRAAAVERGWVPAMAWDDDMIDDPAAQPCMGDVITGVPARVADAIELLDSGEIPEQIAGRLGVTLATLTQNVRRYAPDRATVFNAALGRWRSQAGAA